MTEADIAFMWDIVGKRGGREGAPVGFAERLTGEAAMDSMTVVIGLYS